MSHFFSLSRQILFISFHLNGITYFNSVGIITNLIIIILSRIFHWLMGESRYFSIELKSMATQIPYNDEMFALADWMEACYIIHYFRSFGVFFSLARMNARARAQIKLISTVDIKHIHLFLSSICRCLARVHTDSDWFSFLSVAFFPIAIFFSIHSCSNINDLPCAFYIPSHWF